MVVRAFGEPAEHAGQYLHKGRHVLIDGELRQDEWTDKGSGGRRQRLSVGAHKIIYLGRETPAAMARGRLWRRRETPMGPIWISHAKGT